ncbi:MAG TPA: hypothetical protein VIP98_04025 [Microlunatus sp.]
MSFTPDDTLPARSLAAVCEAYGLGTPVDTVFIARGAMGAVNKITTELDGRRQNWTVKRSYWSHYTEDAIRREVEFTEQCRGVGVPGPRSIPRTDDGSYVLTIDDQPSGDDRPAIDDHPGVGEQPGDDQAERGEHPGTSTQYRVLDWLDGRVGRDDDPERIVPIAEWLAAIHRLAADTDGQPIDPWFIRVDYQWDELATRLDGSAPDLAELIRSRRRDLLELTELVNGAPQDGAVWCHTDVGAENLIWLPEGPWLIDWENSGPLVPRQELGGVIRANADRGIELYAAYRRAGGPAEFHQPSDLATSVAAHLNFLGVQSELLLDESHPEQHDFARNAVNKVGRSVSTMAELEKWIIELSAVG